MSDIPVSQTVITNALNQLNQLAPSSDLAQKGVEVLTKHLAGNILSLSKTSGLFSKTVLLNKPDIKGKIQSDQPHQLKLSLNASTTTVPTLDFFSAASKQSNNVIPLTAKQLQTLLSLPAKQLLVSNPLVTSKNTVQLPQLNATVLPPVPSDARLTKVSAPPPIVDGKPLVTQQTPAQQPATQLRLSLTDQRPPVEVSLPTKSAKSVVVGEKVSLVLSPKSINWQVNIMPTTSQTSPQKTEALQPMLNAASKVTVQSNTVSEQQNLKSNSAEQKVPINAATGKVLIQQILLTPQQASPLIQASLREQSITKPVTLEMLLKAVLQQLNKVDTAQNQPLIQRLQNNPVDKLSIQVLSTGEAKLLVQSSQPVASIVINKELAKELAPLRLPNQQNLQNIVNTKAGPASLPANNLPTTPATAAQLIRDQQKPNTPQQVQSQTVTANIAEKAPVNVTKQANEQIKNPTPPPVTAETKNPTQPLDIKNKNADTPINLKEASAQLLNLIREAPNSQSVVTPALMDNKKEQSNLLQSLLRIVKAKAEVPAVALQSIEKALSDPEFFKASTEQSGKQLIEQVLQQIKQALPQGKEQDSSQIRQLLTSPTLNLSALQMVSPAPSQGIMGGLITLLQISLSARLSRNQAGRSEQISKVLNDFLASSTGNTKAPITPKALNDLSQLEQKHQLMKEIGRLLSGHQTSKLSNAEQLLQGQDTFYYNLPSALGGNLKDIELLIKREEQNKEEKNTEQSSNKTWQLTMKLAVGEIGELLTKAKLREHSLELHFYASNDTLKNQVLNYLPLLRRKLDSLGIEMNKSHCQLGKIPDTLQQRPYHVFQAKA